MTLRRHDHWLVVDWQSGLDANLKLRQNNKKILPPLQRFCVRTHTPNLPHKSARILECTSKQPTATT